MAHFAKIENGIVVFVGVGREDESEEELSSASNEFYRRTSYNTRGGIHYDPKTGLASEDQSKSFRKNYAGIGFTYDSELDAFIPPKKYDSWILNTQTCLWEAPVSYPEDGNKYSWNEQSKSWELVLSK